jgi:hypothetical protein
MLKTAPKIKEALTFYYTELHRNFFHQEPPVFYIFDECYNRAALYPGTIRRSIIEIKVQKEAMI